MLQGQLLDALPITGVFVLIAAILLALYEIGFRVGRWYQSRTPDEKEGPTSMLVGSLLALLAFLLAVTMGMAADRFDSRRQAVLNEANAIGTTYLRAGYLPGQYGTDARALLREYVPLRVNVADRQVLAANFARSAEILDELWKQAEQLARAEPGSEAVALYVETLNETIDMHETRVTAIVYARVPETILLGLLALAMLSLRDGRLQRRPDPPPEHDDRGRPRGRDGGRPDARRGPGPSARRVAAGEPAAAAGSPGAGRGAVTAEGGGRRVPAPAARATAALSARVPPAVGEIVGEVVNDRPALLGLVACCIALAAAGLDPHVLDPGQVRMREALVGNASLESALMIAALAQAAFLLAGGAIADTWRTTRILQAALAGLVIASVGATLMPDGPGLVASRVLAWACDGLILPFSVGVVARLYRGTARATALGILFGVYGAATMLAPVLLTIFGPHGPEVQSFALCAAVSIAAVWAVRRWMPDLPGATRAQRLTVVTTALWAFGIVVAVEGVATFEPLPVAVGALLVVVALGARRLAHRPPEEGVRARQGGAALAAGLVIGLAQAVPLAALPVFFTDVQGIDGLMSSLLLAPVAVAIVVAGPASGWLLGRFSPRALILGGTIAIAAGDFAFAWVLGVETPYLALIVPFLLVGAGFVVATAIRTAVIFASTPSRLPATAAALNEASIGVGARLGTLLIVLVRTGVLVSDSQLDGFRVGLLLAGLMGLVGAVAVFALLGRDDPVRTVWDLRDERGVGVAEA